VTLAAGLALTAAFVALAMLGLWLASLALRNASIVDVWWGPGFAAIAAIAFCAAPAPGARGALILSLTSLWGLRLGAYLLWRNAGAGEDPRYAAMRRRHGAAFPLRSLATVFGLQGALQWGVSLPLQVAMLRPGAPALGGLDALGAALFGVGLFFEAVGDLQLARFKADPSSRGRVMDRGLWRYTRHPNYFGDFLVWWGLFAIAASTPLGPWTFASPIVMSVLLMRVSGVPLLERSLARTRPGYREYQERTPAFFPRLPRRVRRAAVGPEERS
jgi:steroid 5-alpha reductase family enzyme